MGEWYFMYLVYEDQEWSFSDPYKSLGSLSSIIIFEKQLSRTIIRAQDLWKCILIAQIEIIEYSNKYECAVRNLPPICLLIVPSIHFIEDLDVKHLVVLYFNLN